MNTFTHLHVHTEYSFLDGLAKLPKLIDKAYDDGQRAIAITDHGNMYGVFEFISLIEKKNKKIENPNDKIKGIIGCEMYVARNSRFSKTAKEDRSGRHLILLAKNMEGYRNLSRLCSFSFIEGFYYVPRIDKELLRKYSAGLIACSACLGGELAKAITNHNQMLPNGKLPENLNLTEADKVVTEFKEIFGDDYYLEMQMNGYDEQHLVNHAISILSERHQVKYIATNDVHYVNKEDFETHKVLICVNTRRNLVDSSAATQDTDSDNGMAYSGMEFLCTADEMRQRFAQYPDAIDNAIAIADKIENISLVTDPLLPEFPIPDDFDNEFEYLVHLVNEGSKERWPAMHNLLVNGIESDESKEIKERIDFELSVIKNMGFPGYFLIVWDFMIEGRKLGVRFGPGRGSAAGSIIAYCLNITNVDPLKYHLLFERFLNPDRISLPDMDIDMDDEGREKVMQYVRKKYGEDKVAQIVTFQTMAAKSSIKDCARVLNLPLTESNRLAKLVPDKPGTKLKDALETVPEFKQEVESDNDLIRRTLNFAFQLENTVRGSGVHACGLIIGKESLYDLVPLSAAKNSEIPVTQYEGKDIENAGLLKMDFLGLKTLNIIESALKLIKQTHNIDINIDAIPLDDELTYQLLGRGDTTCVFQLESPGMRKYLAELKPERFEDIIAMVALYRPGPMDKIPDFIKRKAGLEPIKYDIDVMEKYLHDTYGITIYQEQVMLLSRLLSNFTPGKADTLRKAMGKKNLDLMASLHNEFLEGGKANGHKEETLKKIWTEWEKFASYAFNKSHATCYGLVAYQTAYLKAHYRSEFLAANLTNNLDKMDNIKKIIDDSIKSGIKVLGPTINESYSDFSVNSNSDILFGMAALKGVGISATEAIIKERKENGIFTSIFDFIKRVDLRSCTRRSIEALAYSGAFDCFENIHRAQFFNVMADNSTFLEKLVSWGTREQSEVAKQQISMFGEVEEEQGGALPDIPTCEPWAELRKLKEEFNVAGFFISGHPLDKYAIITDNFCNTTIDDIKTDNIRKMIGKNISFAAMVTQVKHVSAAENPKGNDYGRTTLEDLSGSYEMMFFGQEYLKIKSLLEPDALIYLQCSVTEPYNYNKDKGGPPPRLRITPIKGHPLYEAAQHLIKKITIVFNINSVNGEIALQLKKLAEENKGETPVNVRIETSDGKISTNFSAFELKVSSSNFIEALHTLPVHYDIIVK